MHVINKHYDGEYEVLESNQEFKIYFNREEYNYKYNEIREVLNSMLNTTKVGSAKHNKIEDAVKRLEYLNGIVNKIMYTNFDIFNALNKTSKGTIHKNRNIRVFDTGVKGEWFNQIHGTDLQLVLRHHNVSGSNILFLNIEFNYKHKTPSIFSLDI